MNLLISVMSLMRCFVLLAAVHKIRLCNDFPPEIFFVLSEAAFKKC